MSALRRLDLSVTWNKSTAISNTETDWSEFKGGLLLAWHWSIQENKQTVRTKWKLQDHSAVFNLRFAGHDQR